MEIFSEASFCLAAGVTLLLFVAVDVFQSIIVPHYRSSNLRLSPFLISRVWWPPVQWLAQRAPNSTLRQELLTLFAPSVIVGLLVTWMSVMITGFACLLWTERMHCHPAIKSFHEAVYVAASSVLTIGCSDITVGSPLSRFTVVCAAGSGIILLTITISFLFAVQSHFHSREVNSQIIVARTNFLASGLLTYQSFMAMADAGPVLELCERWLIDLYQSHTAYPLLSYFRSRSSRVPWLLQLAAVLDAATVILAVGPDKYVVVARSIYNTGCRALAALTSYLDLNPRAVPEQCDLTLPELFAAMGIENPQEAARKFVSMRRLYYGELRSVCQFFLVPEPELSLVDSGNLKDSLGLQLHTQKGRLPSPGSTSELPVHSGR